MSPRPYCCTASQILRLKLKSPVPNSFNADGCTKRSSSPRQISSAQTGRCGGLRSCAHESLSETFPLHSINQYLPTRPPGPRLLTAPVFEHNGRRMSGKTFKDTIRQKKENMKACMDRAQTTSTWMSLLSSYMTSYLTFESDRVVALRGVSELFRSLCPDHQLENSTYHSGLWSTDVLRQLSWARRLDRKDWPQRRRDERYLIPTWSPLREPGVYTYFGKHDPLVLLPNKFISWDVSYLDKLGRATDWRGCQMHLQGVLTHVKICAERSRVYPQHEEVYPADTGEADNLEVIWDNAEELEIARRRALPVEFRALIMALTVFQHDCYDELPSSMTGIVLIGVLLRDFTAPGEDSIPPDSKRAPRWVRCGLLIGRFINDSKEEYELQRQEIFRVQTTFQIPQKYGVIWDLEDLEEGDKAKWRWKQRRLHDPILEDIYIV